jgi:hypothetical protein
MGLVAVSAMVRRSRYKGRFSTNQSIIGCGGAYVAVFKKMLRDGDYSLRDEVRSLSFFHGR